MLTPEKNVSSSEGAFPNCIVDRGVEGKTSPAKDIEQASLTKKSGGRMEKC